MLTVVFSSFNGEKTLRPMLESFKAIQEPEGGWKIVAVDNGSTDSTRDILVEYSKSLPLKVVDQPRRGKNIALNSGLPHISGDLVVFTDDDVIASETWLVALRATANERQDYDVFGGHIRPKWPRTPPSWVFTSIPMNIVYAIKPDSLEEGPINPGAVWGPNMAVRSRVFEAGYKFDESVGPGPGNYRMGSETEFTTRLVRVGGVRCWYTPRAVVWHVIRDHQLTRDWATRRGYRLGRDMYWKENASFLRIADPPEKVAKLLGLPRWYYRDALEGTVDIVLGKLKNDVDRLVRGLWRYWYWRGYFKEAVVSGIFRRQSLK